MRTAFIIHNFIKIFTSRVGKDPRKINKKKIQ